MSEEKRRPGHVYHPENPVPEHLRPQQAPEVRGKLRDVDSANQAFRLKAFAWSGWLGILGMFAGMKLAHDTGLNPLITIPAGLVLGWAFAYFAGMGVANVWSRMGPGLYLPNTTASAREYSRADALRLRGQFLEAAAELERAARTYPGDTVPRLRLARLYRDELQRPDDAITWFRSIVETDVDAATEQAVLRELIEVYTHRLRRPRAAAPWLARLAERHPDSAAGIWARTELAELKREMREE